jgi:hypothetical protein
MVTLAFTIACVPSLIAKWKIELATFVIRTPDGKTGTITINPRIGRWDADPVAAKILGSENGDWVPSDFAHGLFLMSYKLPTVLSYVARLHWCVWSMLDEGDHGEMNIDPGGRQILSDWDKAPIRATWECTNTD